MRREARQAGDCGLRPDLAEGPGFSGAGAHEDVVLGVVEDVAGVGFGDSGVVFAEGWVEGDGGVKFDAVGLWIC